MWLSKSLTRQQPQRKRLLKSERAVLKQSGEDAGNNNEQEVRV
jgi:hypothetical protein